MRLEDDYPKVHAVIEAVESCATENEAAYICFMAVRLIECHRILKPTGSIYVHCDDHANGYLRMLLDSIFGPRNFRNSIVWKRTTRGFKGSQFSARSFNSNTDSILFYRKSPGAFFDLDRVLEPYEPGYLERAFKLSDDKGRYYLDAAFNRQPPTAPCPLPLAPRPAIPPVIVCHPQPNPIAGPAIPLTRPSPAATPPSPQRAPTPPHPPKQKIPSPGGGGLGWGRPPPAPQFIPTGIPIHPELVEG